MITILRPLRCPALALASIGVLALVAGPDALRAGPQVPPDDKTGGLDRTERELGALGRLAEMPDLGTRQKAIRAYNRGLAFQDKAWKLEEQAAAATGKKAAHKAAQADKAYRKAIEQFRVAITHVPDFPRALGSLGLVLLETGQYAEALDAYDRALEIGPLYAAAIEERGEVYLGLNRIEEAKGAYRELVQVDRELAAELMSAMRRWVERRRDDAGGLSEETIESFAAWIDEQREGAPVGAGRSG